MHVNHLKKILNKQFKIAEIDLSYDDIKDNQVKNWYTKYKYSKDQNEKWQQWTQKYLQKHMRYTKDQALITSAWLNLQYGLKVKK